MAGSKTRTRTRTQDRLRSRKYASRPKISRAAVDVLKTNEVIKGTFPNRVVLSLILIIVRN